MALHQWFIPHKDTHKKAHLLSWEGLLIYIMLFILLQVGFSIVSYSSPGVLGISADLDQKRIIELTNKEREKNGLAQVSENEALSRAAYMKAQNMFEEDYWAHFAPSGKTPWDFILGAGYKFTFAGENLAKNFYNSEDVVEAWMNSTSHRENLLNPKYQDIGIAVVEGVLNGQTTTLVVQEFGTTRLIASTPSVKVAGQEIEISSEEYSSKPDLVLVASEKSFAKPFIDPYSLMKIMGFSVIVFMAILLALDVWILKRRGVFRISSSHIAHMGLLSLTAGNLYIAGPGAVL